MQSNHQNALPGSDSRRRSFRLRQVMAMLTSLVVAVVVLFAVMSVHLLQRHLESLRVKENYERLSIAQDILAQRLEFYEDLLHSYAADIRIRDLIGFGDQAGAVAWSAEVRSALPQAIGAALFTADGEVLGDPMAQRVGNSCIADLRDAIGGGHAHRTPLHTAMPSLAHFDLAAPVFDESGEAAGLVFVSFTIDELTKAVHRLANSNSAAALLDRATRAVAATSSNWDSLAGSVEQTIEVQGSDWLLSMRIEGETLMPALPALGATILLGAILVILLMLVFHSLLVRNYFDVVEDVRTVIRQIADGGTGDVRDVVERSRLFPVIDELRDDLARLGSHHESLHLESRTDALTKLANRRVFDDGLAYLLNARETAGTGSCVVLLDLDDFKMVNDRYGHARGDLVLTALATALNRVARGSDLASRWGGDEFAVLLTKMDEPHVAAWIERLRQAFAAAQRDTPGLPDELQCGVSLGYSPVLVDDARDAQAVLRDADASLYRDKRRRKRPAVA